jgi:hypothetical protein
VRALADGSPVRYLDGSCGAMVEAIDTARADR